MLEYLSTPLGPDIPSPSELMGRQFRGILPFFQDHGAAESVKEQVMLQKEKEKCKHDTSAHDLPVIPVGATVTYINKDRNIWSIDRVESHEGRSDVVATEREGWSLTTEFICTRPMYHLVCPQPAQTNLLFPGWSCLSNL